MILKTLLFALLITLLENPLHETSAYASPDDRAKALVRAAIEEMGGEDKLRAVKSVQIDGVGHPYLIEQSERPKGPWIVDYQKVASCATTARKDFDALLRRGTYKLRSGRKAPG